MASQYEKQRQWRQAVLSKASKLQEELETAKESDTPFTPVIYTTAPVKIEEANPRRFQASGQLHVDRQMRARKEKEEQQKKLIWRQKKKTSTVKPVEDVSQYQDTSLDIARPDVTMNPSSSIFESDRRIVSLDAAETFRVGGRDRGREGGRESPTDEKTRSREKDDETLLDTLLRERREWAIEKAKIESCIRDQQLELQSEISASQISSDIAKEFAEIIAIYESRLVSVEDSVQREIMAVKSMAASLQVVVASLTTTLLSNRQRA